MSSNLLVAVMGITIYTVWSGFISTYIFSKAKKTLLLAFYTAAASSMLLWSIVKLLEVVSPTLEIKEMYKSTQYVLALIFIATLLCFIGFVYHKRLLDRRPTFFLAIGMLLTPALTWLYFSQPSPLFSTYILLAMFLSINLSIFFYRDRIFPEIEISLDSIVENVKDRVAVFDLNGSLVDMNLRALLEALIPAENSTLSSFILRINGHSKYGMLEIDKILSLQNNFYEKEICIESAGSTAYYIFNAGVIKNKKGEKVGTVCTLRDITENKLISLELEHKNSELESLNRELGDYIRIADSLAEEKERAQIAREINSTVGQKLTEILSVLEVIKLTGKEDGGVFEKPLNEAIANCREVLVEIRVVVSRLIPDKHKGGKAR